MANLSIPVLLKGTEVAGRAPATGDIVERQLAVNLIDGKLYSKTSTGQIVRVGGLTASELALVATSGNYNDLSNKPTITQYVLPPATASVLGGIMVGDGLTANGSGLLVANVLSVAGQNGTPKTGAVVITRSDLGLDILDSNNKIEFEYLPDSIVGAMIYKGTYDASTNTPALPDAASGNTGWLYVVSVAGTYTPTTGDPIPVDKGDWLISNGTIWQRVAAVVSDVLTVNGATGNVVINASNLPGLSAVGRTGEWDDILDKPNFAAIAVSGSWDDIVDKPTFAPVALSGDYNDLENLPPDPAVSNIGFTAIGQPILQGSVPYPYAQQITYPQNWAGSVAFFRLYTGTTATVQLNRIRAGVSTNVGSIQYAANGTVTFTSTETSPVFLANDQLEWVWPGNIAQFTCNMVGIRAA